MLGIALGRHVFEATTAIAEEVSAAADIIAGLATWLALSAAFVCFAGALAVEELCSTANHPGTAPSMEAFPASFPVAWAEAVVAEAEAEDEELADELAEELADELAEEQAEQLAEEGQAEAIPGYHK